MTLGLFTRQPQGVGRRSCSDPRLSRGRSRLQLAQGIRHGVQLGWARVPRTARRFNEREHINLFRMLNFDSAANAATGQLNGGPGSINGTVQKSRASGPNRSGDGVFAFGSSRRPSSGA